MISMSRGISFVLTTALLAGSLAAQEPAAPPPTPSIVTSGEAVVRRVPDQAFVTLSVDSRARNPRDAQRQNAEAMTMVQQRVAAAGIGKDAIRTTGYSIQQEFDYANGRRTPRDYIARNGLEVRLDEVERTGEILDVAVQAGVTTVAGIRFDIKDRPRAEREALGLAVADARARAEALAAAAGRTVDRVLRIDDSRQNVPPRVMQMEMRARSLADDAVSTPVEPGTIEIRAQIVLTVAIE
ncbi:MAG: DUF541 domain-containing protein [Luteitalea sp.]|nr:DUF541 domain-containing protein [Luteitalea sp.]